MMARAMGGVTPGRASSSGRLAVLMLTPLLAALRVRPSRTPRTADLALEAMAAVAVAVRSRTRSWLRGLVEQPRAATRAREARACREFIQD